MTDEKKNLTNSTAPLLPSGDTSFWRKHPATTAALVVASPVALGGFIMLIYTLSNRDRANAAKDYMKSHSIGGDNGASNATVLSVLSALALIICFIILYEILKQIIKHKPPASTPLPNNFPTPTLTIKIDESKYSTITPTSPQTPI